MYNISIFKLFSKSVDTTDANGKVVKKATYTKKTKKIKSTSKTKKVKRV